MKFSWTSQTSLHVREFIQARSLMSMKNVKAFVTSHGSVHYRLHIGGKLCECKERRAAFYFVMHQKFIRREPSWIWRMQEIFLSQVKTVSKDSYQWEPLGWMQRMREKLLPEDKLYPASEDKCREKSLAVQSTESFLLSQNSLCIREHTQRPCECK